MVIFSGCLMRIYIRESILRKSNADCIQLGWDNPPAFTSEAQAFDYAGALEEQDEEAESNGIGNAN